MAPVPGRKVDYALTEVDVANTQVNGLADAQPVARDQTQNGIVAFSDQCCPIGCGEQLLDVFPRDRMRKPIQLAREQNRYVVDKVSRQQCSANGPKCPNGWLLLCRAREQDVVLQMNVLVQIRFQLLQTGK